MEQAPSSFSMFFKHYMKTRHLQLILKKHYTVLKKKTQLNHICIVTMGKGMT